MASQKLPMAVAKTTTTAQTQTTPVILSPVSSSKFEQGLTLIINTWQALTLAVQNQWGGPDSSDKRDWMCGAVADLFTGNLFPTVIVCAQYMYIPTLILPPKS